MTSNTGRKRVCSICGEALIDDAYRPFCSKRCANVDLGRWLSDRYTIAGGASDEADDEARAPATPDRDDEA